ncbi:hypothetical protein [Halorubrum pallidum]|uniref:Uncharacterized protein n=1 Tax=Halorubrum pallidum TaxID=1526114 RepID=A0ABD5T053_9EURY
MNADRSEGTPGSTGSATDRTEADPGRSESRSDPERLRKRLRRQTADIERREVGVSALDASSGFTEA